MPTYKTVQFKDWVTLFAAQKNEARFAWGETSVALPGRSDIRYANLTGTQWQKLKSFWSGPLNSVNDRVVYDRIIQGIIISPLLMSDSASRDAWKREYAAYQTEVGWINTALATGYGSTVLPEAVSVGFWRKIEPLILRSGGIFETPRPYEILAEAIAESARDLTKTVARGLLPTIPTWMKWAAVGVGALWLTHKLTKGERR